MCLGLLGVRDASGPDRVGSVLRGVIVVLFFVNGMRIAGLLGFIAAIGIADAGGGNPSAKQLTPQQQKSARDRLIKSEQKFLENKGQWDKEAQFLSRGPSLNVWYEQNGVDFDYYKVEHLGKGKNRRIGQTIRMSFVGASKNLKFDGNTVVGGKTDFIAGKAPIKSAHSYKEVFASNVYPGVNLRGYYSEGNPRYDFQVSPHTDPSKIQIHFTGAKSVAVSRTAITLGTRIGGRQHGDLRAYQIVDGKQVQVAAAFDQKVNGDVAFKLGKYDSSKTLVIDPLVYGSYYGGDHGFDEVRSVVSNTNGEVYLTGDTQSLYFPAIDGPYGYNLIGVQNAFLSELEGDAYNQDYAAFIGGSDVDTSQYVKLDPFNDVWIAGNTTSSDFPGNTRPNDMFLSYTGGGTATGGTFVLDYAGQISPAIPYNASPAQVALALNEIPALQNNVVSVTSSGGTVDQGATYEIKISNGTPLVLQVITTRITFQNPQNNTVTEYSQGLPALFIVKPEQVYPAAVTSQIIERRGSEPLNNGPNPSGVHSTFTLTVTDDTGAADTTKPIPSDATAAVIQKALTALGNVGTTAGAVTVTDIGTSGQGTVDYDPMMVVFNITNGGNMVDPMTVANNCTPVPVYSISKFPYLFLMPFHQPTNGGPITPLPTQTKIYGSDFGQEMNGFDIRQNPQPTSSTPIDIVFTGNTSTAQPEIPGFPGGSTGYMARYTFSFTSGYTQSTVLSRYVTGSGVSVNNRGAVLDAQGNLYVCGTVNAGETNYDTSINPVFVTTPGGFTNGRLLKFSDIYFRKYDTNGNIVLSELIGGHGFDSCGGFDLDVDLSDVPTGSAIAIDPSDNIYVTGISHSYDFPRTRGAYNQDFTDAQNVTCTEVSADGTTILYSTNLNIINGGSEVMPAGIAVDSRGDAFITGNIHPFEVFPEDEGETPGNPDQPIGQTSGGIQTTSDAFETSETGPTSPDLATSSDWINVLNSNGSALLFGSYLGGKDNNRVYAPYVDAFGDCWAYGWTDSGRYYVVFSSTGTPTIYNDSGAELPASMISPNAFKSYGDADGFGDPSGDTYVNTAYGAADEFQNPFLAAPYYYPIAESRDGWVIKIRVGLPSVASVILNPTTIPGGLGASSTGTITLSAAAPTNGATVNVSIPTGSAASFSSSSTGVTTTTVTIAAGATTGTFTVYSEGVAAITSVPITANYEGSFQVALLTVIPWLSQLQITPTTVVGGNTVSGNISLAAPAPTGGVTVTLTTNQASYVNFGGSNTVTVPAGQTTQAFTIDTNGVDKDLTANVVASAQGYNTSQNLTLTPASLLSLTFSPASVPGGTSATGTVTLNGEAGPSGINNVKLSASPSAGFTLTPSTISIPQNSGSQTFTIGTPISSAAAQVTVTANMPAQGSYTTSSASGTLFIDVFALTGLSLSVNEISSGGTTTGMVTISAPAPASGVVVNLSSSNPAVASVPTSVTIPQGVTSVTFTITGGFVAQNTNVTIKATRGTASFQQVLTVDQLAVMVSLDPSEVVGGASSQGTVTISNPATTNLVLKLTSSNAAIAQVPSTVTIPSGSTTGTFNVTTNAVSNYANSTITAIFSPSTGGTSSGSEELFVDPVGILSITFNPDSIIGGRQSTVATVTLQGAAGAQGATVTLSQSGTQLILPPSVLVPAGKTSLNFTIGSRAVSRNISDTVTATYNGSTLGVVIVTR